MANENNPSFDDVHEDEGLDQSIVLEIDGENHTFGNAIRDMLWAHPHVELASYTQEHPSSTEIVMRCQTTSAISAEQGVIEALHMAKQVLDHVGDTMNEAVQDWEQKPKKKR